MKSSSESMVPVEAVVKGVGGAAVGVESRLAEAVGFFLVGWESSGTDEDIFASAALRFRVRGGILPVWER